jgi:hypothetical protein
MSFIFDALKKLEQEKGRIPSPDYLKDKFLKQISQSSELLRGDLLKNLSLKDLSVEKLTQTFRKSPDPQEGLPIRTVILGVVTVLVVILYLSGAFEAKKKSKVVIGPSTRIPSEFALLAPTPALPASPEETSPEVPGWEEGKPLTLEQFAGDLPSPNINPFSRRPRPKTLVERMGDPFQQPVLLNEDGTPVVIDESQLEPSWEEEPKPEPEIMVAEAEETPLEETVKQETPPYPTEEPVEPAMKEKETETRTAAVESIPEFDLGDLETGGRSIKRSELTLEPEAVEEPVEEEGIEEEPSAEEVVPSAAEQGEPTPVQEERMAEGQPAPEETEELAVASLPLPTPTVNVLAEMERRRNQILIEGIIYNRDPSRSFVLLRNLSTNSSTIVREGEEFLGMTVAQINLKDVQFQFFDQTLVLKVD